MGGDVGSSARHWLGADVGACGTKVLVVFLGGGK